MLLDLARMTTATTGTGTVTLGSAVTGFLSFAAAGAVDGRTYRYAIRDGANSEIGYGVYTSSGTTFTRNVLKSTNSDNAISLSGSAEIFITAGTEDFLGQTRLSPSQITSNQNDYSPTNAAKNGNWALDADADGRQITGIATGWFGRVLVLENIGSKLIKLVAASSSSSAANRFNIPNDVGLLPKAVCVLYHNGTNWQMLVMPVIGKYPLWVPAAAMKPRTSNGCAALATVETSTNKVNLSTLDFDPSADEYAQFTFPAIKGWDKSTITAKFCWKHASTTTNFGVRWTAAGQAFTDDDAGDTAFGTAQTVDDTGGTTNDIYWSAETSAITIGSSPATGDLVHMQVGRVGSNSGQDTMAIDAGLIGVMLYLNMTAPTED